jgi:cobyrinic acid a,c-diamide synthase
VSAGVDMRAGDAPISVPRVVIAAPASGAGKTTVAAALMRAACDRGLRVAPFKVGPDYIDPSHHRVAAGRPSRNLDGWMLPHSTVLALFGRATSGAHAADLAVVEGVMGLFDGRTGTSEEGSTAQMAKLLRAPVVLVLDASAMARTAGAVVHGLHTFDDDLRLAGVVLNRMGSERHYEMCAAAIRERTQVPVLGWLPKDPAIGVPSRHLGLVLAGENPINMEQLGARAAETLDVDGLLTIARNASTLAVPASDLLPPPVTHRRARIAIARDAAFDFYYEDNLDLLRSLGAELVPYSPMSDAALPADVGALYLGGGYPELHAAGLSANTAMLADVRAFAASGRPVYAECGGLMYLADAFVAADESRFQMAGVIPGVSRLAERLTIGYREMRALRDSPIALAGQFVRGHEFHHSSLTHGSGSPAYLRSDIDQPEGIVGGPRGNVLASYLHVHFGADPRLAERFVGLAAGE